MNKRPNKTLNRRIIKLFMAHAWRHKRYVIGLFIVVPLFSLTFRFLPPLIVANILNRISDGQYVAGNLWESFGPSLLLFAGLTLVGGMLLGRLINFFNWKLEMRVLQDIHQRIFDHLIVQSSNFHANRFAGSMVSQANKFGGAYIRTADTTIYGLSQLILSFIFTIVILAPRVPWVAAFLILFSLLFMFIATRITRKTRVLITREAAAATRQTGFLADAISNILAVKGFAREAFEKKRYGGAVQATRSASREVMHISMRNEVVFSIFTAGLGIVALSLSVASVVLWQADIANIFLVVAYTGLISQGLWDFGQSTLKNYNRALGDAVEMTEILAIEPEVKDPGKPETAIMNKGHIAFKDMVFTHAGDTDTLFDGLNLEIQAGEKVGLIGRSGGGKTTLTKLLLRFSDIDGGSIEIDGQDISKVSQDDLRSHITYVPQEPLLFHRSLAENISYGHIGASQQQIVKVAKVAHADEFINKLPHGYDTLVGERGVKLSGGQRQRVAIARAMIKDAPILVLDEATSALDSESEVLIQDALWKLMEGRTAIVIAHRLSTIQRMDRIIVMDNGKIVEQGTHKELIEGGGIYAELWSHQSGGFIED